MTLDLDQQAAFQEIMAAKDAEIERLREQRDELLAKLEALLCQVDSLEGRELTRDLSICQAEEIWDETLRSVRGAIKRCKP